MACSQTKRLANASWPLYRTTGSGLCCYVVAVNSENDAAKIVADAQNKPNYVKRSQFYAVPNNMVQVYLYFSES